MSCAIHGHFITLLARPQFRGQIPVCIMRSPRILEEEFRFRDSLEGVLCVFVLHPRSLSGRKFPVSAMLGFGRIVTVVMVVVGVSGVGRPLLMLRRRFRRDGFSNTPRCIS